MWWLLPTLFLCGLGETIGWSGRLWSSFSPNLHKAFLMQVISLVIAPTPFIAVVFILLSWMVVYLGPCYARLSPKAYTPIFLSADIIALLIQSAGGSIASAATTFARTQLGAHLLLAGIAFQLVALSVYLCLFIEFAYRYFNDKPIFRRGHTFLPFVARTKPASPKHITMLSALGFVSLVLLIRSVYRTVQLAGGWKGRIMRNELDFNLLDGMMMMLAMVAFNVAHPGRLLGPQKPALHEGSGAGKGSDVSLQRMGV
ncbi:RTA1-domain-containing protein [Mycena kentingensis (nom. inval.)]|nr:RTA1-domain-containing protein [Mycena kentingensis (nom. inval.)]